MGITSLSQSEESSYSLHCIFFFFVRPSSRSFDESRERDTIDRERKLERVR